MTSPKEMITVLTWKQKLQNKLNLEDNERPECSSLLAFSKFTENCNFKELKISYRNIISKFGMAISPPEILTESLLPKCDKIESIWTSFSQFL